MKIAPWLILCALCFSPCLASADQTLKEELENTPTPSEQTIAQPADNSRPAEVEIAADKMAHEFQVLREKNKVEEVIALCILAFVSLVTVLYFLAKKDDQPGLHIVHATGLIFITFGTIILVIMAETEQQLTAAIGILGGIAGYLFGSMKGKDTESGKKIAVESSDVRER